MKKIKTFVLTFCVISVQFLQAQISLKGQVNDVTNQESLPGVIVNVEELKQSTFTDENGQFTFGNLKPGEYLLQFSSEGYQNVTKNIFLRHDTVLNIALSPSATELNNVVVTAISRATEKKFSPIAIKTVNAEDLQQNSATNIIDALKNVPGISQITTGAAISKPIVRGLGYNRVLTLNNGIRQEGQQWGDEHGIEIDGFSVDRVEIIKGPGSLIYGSDGIAGVINFLPPKPLPNHQIKTKIFTNYQSNNNLIGTSVLNEGTKNDLQWLAQVSHKIAGDYRNKYDGRVFNSGFKELDGKLFLGLNKNWGHTHLTINSFNTHLGIVEGDRDSLGRFTFENADGEIISATTNDLKGFFIAAPSQKINHFSVASNSFFLLKKGRLRVDLGFQKNLRREFESAEEPTIPGLFLELNTYNYSVRYELEQVKGWETTVGIGGMFQQNKNRGDEFLIPDYASTDVGAFATTQKNFNKFTLSGGLRYDFRFVNSKTLIEDQELKFEAFQRNFNGISASIGLSYRPTEVSTFKINFSRGYRAPNIAELASNGVHEGTFRYEIGTTDLKTENSNQIDLGYYFNSEHISLEVTPFVNFVNHFVYLQRWGNHFVENTPAYEYTQGNAVLFGGELFIDFHPHPLDWLHISNSFAYVQGNLLQQRDSMRYLPNIPAPRYRGEIKAQFKKVGKVLNNSFIKFSVDYYFPQNLVFSAYETETASPGYVLLGAGIGTDFQLFHRKDFMTLIFSCDNLANIAYQDHLNRLRFAPVNPLIGRVGVFNSGRNFSVKLLFNI